MSRISHHIVVTWRESEATIQSLEKPEFDAMSRAMIDDGFCNLLVEWYESRGAELPDKISVFVYWEAPDTAPDYAQVRRWGSEREGHA